jgi:hypothetical protein
MIPTMAGVIFPILRRLRFHAIVQASASQGNEVALFHAFYVRRELLAC